MSQKPIIKSAKHLFWIVPMGLLLAGLRVEQGCGPGGKSDGCYGPIGKYLTLWGPELQYQIGLIGMACIAAIFAGVFAGFILKKNRAVVTIAMMGTLLWAFLAMVLFMPVIVLY